MSGSLLAHKRIRKNFGKIKKVIEIPDLIGMQKESFNRFLQMDVKPEDREHIGLQAVFKSVLPIKDFTGSASLEFVSYSFGEVKHSVNECVSRGMTYEIPVLIRIMLQVYDVDKEAGTSSIRDIKEQKIYFGTIPLMTDKGTFIINGTERAVVSQLHRSSGVFFDHDKGKTHSSGKIIYTARIIPVRGSWIDMEIDIKDIVHLRIDRRRKFPVTLLFKAFGYTNEELLDYFYEKEKIFVKKNKYYREFREAGLKGQKSSREVKDPATGKLIVAKGRIFSKRVIKQLKEAKIDMIPVSEEYLAGKVFASAVMHPGGEEPVAKAAELVEEDGLQPPG